MTAHKKVIVVGGGITGLAAAHRVLELARGAGRAVDVQLFEANDRLGGTIKTTHRDGFLIEGGPDSFITQKPWGLALCRRLGIDSQLIQTNPACRRTFVVREGVMHAVPEGFLLLAPTKIMPFAMSRLFSWRGKLRMGMDLILPRRHHGPDTDESLSSFVRRRFGHEALERVAQPLVGGIYTADPEDLSLRATMPRFLDMEVAHRSIILGMRKGRKSAQAPAGDSGARYSLFVSFERGMSTLIDTLAGRLPPGAVHLDARAQRFVREEGGWTLHLSDGSAHSADAVILACPAYASASLLRPLDTMLADELDAIRYASSATMTIAVRNEQLPRPLDGFGFVVPAVETRSLIAVTLSSTKFAGRAPEGYTLMRAFLGGAMHAHVYDLPDDVLRESILRDLRDLMGVTGEPLFIEMHRWPRSMPQYPVGHLDRVRRIDTQLEKLPGVALAGNAFGGVGVPDCVHSAEKAVDRLLSAMNISAAPASGATG